MEKSFRGSMRCFKLCILVFLLPVNPIKCQDTLAKMKISEKTYDFGVVYEADGLIKTGFLVENVGELPFKINRIVSPGDIQVDYPKDSIYAGESLRLMASVNPFNQVGYYNKQVLVFSDAEDSPLSLEIKGMIIKGSFSEKFNYEIGGLKFRQTQLNFGYVFKGKEVVGFFPVINSNNFPVTVRFDSVPNYVKIKESNWRLDPGQKYILEVRYNTNLLSDWDFVIDRIKVTVVGENSYSDEITIAANIREDFSKLTDEERRLKPKLSMPVQVFNFDTIQSGSTVYYDFPVVNNGSRDLSIRAVKPTCGCTIVESEKTIIPPGDSTAIRVAFNTTGFDGANKKGITVITNDPDNYKMFLWIAGYVD